MCRKKVNDAIEKEAFYQKNVKAYKLIPSNDIKMLLRAFNCQSRDRRNVLKNDRKIYPTLEHK